ncbi:hypothetical protein K469DRAFT_259310 [Zopfia rhizophila CBS 207.26]|uniref:Uncharacterized protein n=1 Tax=Zopfia rhizophila CBS 207.26 TaxID=1314779 RepID=A0A6A6DRA0_9PEZI|nr:hypothetical protein K469DRAFT_260965 [Zopfia rhizophila CBS 207.26]KAF2181475.1 hypothetical protein K469DRAFT_259310 [Zopfia rhizophila CBS 207.26]
MTHWYCCLLGRWIYIQSLSPSEYLLANAIHHVTCPPTCLPTGYESCLVWIARLATRQPLCQFVSACLPTRLLACLSACLPVHQAHQTVKEWLEWEAPFKTLVPWTVSWRVAGSNSGVWLSSRGLAPTSLR